MPEVGRYNAGQKLVFWAMSLLILVLFVSGIVIWDTLFLRLHHDRAEAHRAAGPRLAAVGDHRLDRACLRRDLGARHHPGDDARHVTAGWAWRHHRKWLRELARRRVPGE